ncbi:MAG: aminotransferase class I/II-fold pyridoxal phosphate-dependent enzyme [Chitinivibrionia bacterium]|nr:aminotransferase class I/II-fold pyridoxal phosphate-dependent enzyme [Chitinivibrionia bacterium]
MNVAERYAGVEISQIRKMNALAKPDTINLGIGQLPYPLAESIKNAGILAFESGEAKYTANIGDENLRKAVIKEYNEENSLNYQENNVVITNGSQGAIWNIFSVYLNFGDKVLLPNICFSAYETIIKIHGAKVIFYKLDENFQIDTADFEKKLNSNPDAKFALINSPSNPCGSVFSEEQIRKICEITNKTECFIISDEVYNKLYFGEKPLSPAKFAKNCITVNGISKRCAATGLRIGWAVAKKEIIENLVVANQYTCTCANNISQLAAIQAFSSKTETFCEEVRKKLEENANILYNALLQIPEISAVKPQGAFYCMANISRFGTSKDVSMSILENCNVLTIPGIAFGADADKYIRISFAVESELLKTALERMKGGIRKI